MVKIGSFITRVLSAGSYPPRPWRFRIAAMLVLLGLVWPLTQYMRLVLRNPERTGLLVIGTNYSAPWDINPWCEENLAALEKLNKHNLSVRRLTSPSLLAFGQWAELCDDVEHLVAATGRQQPLLVYVNLHGIVASDGRPCLLVGESKPWLPATWLSLDELVQKIRQSLPRPRQLIIAIEGGRQTAAASTSVVFDQNFADAVRQWYAALESSGQARDLSLMISNSSRFGSVQQAGLAGDLFTTCLVEALGGECDQAQHGGNADQRIQWHELDHYVHQQVELRSRRLRVVPQLTESFCANDDVDFVAWDTAFQPQMLYSESSREISKASLESLANAWKQCDRLRTSAPWRDQPDSWSQLQRVMVAWEQSIFGGDDVRSRASQPEKLAWDLLARLEKAVAQREEAAGLEGAMCRQAAHVWRQLAHSPAWNVASQLSKSAQEVGPGQALCQVPLLVQMLEQTELRIWQEPERLGRWAECQARLERWRVEQLGLPCLAKLVSLEQRIDTQCRWLADKLLVDQLDAEWDAELSELDRLIEQGCITTERLRQVIAFTERALAGLPVLYRCVDLMDGAEQGQHVGQLGQAEEKLSPQLTLVEQTLQHHRDKLAMALEDETISIDVGQAEQMFDRLLAAIVQRWQRSLVQSPANRPAVAMLLESCLSAGLLPVEAGSIDKAVQMRLDTYRRLAEMESSASDDSQLHAALDFGMLNEDRLRSWLTKAPEDQAANRQASQALPQSFKRMFRARALAAFGLDAEVTRPVVAWREQVQRLRRLRAGHRMVDDFWKLPLVDGLPYYEAATRSFLSCVDEGNRSELEAILSSRRHAAREGLRLECKCRPVWSDGDLRQTACRIEEAGPGLPVGLAALRLTGAEGTKRLSPRIKVPVGQGDRKAHVLLKLDALDGGTARQSVAAELSYRGHRFVSSMDLYPKVDQASTGTTYGPGLTSIGVQSLARQRRARMVVLDCSASMLAVQANEGSFDPASPQQQPSRLDAARFALESILDRWRGQSDYVGVMFYGHRVALGTKEQGKLLQTRYLSRYPLARDVEAYEDVETVLPPGRFGDQEFGEVVERLRALVPWGQTPLYLSVMQATEELARFASLPEAQEQVRTDLDVIVVSDGRNYQFNPAPEKNIGLDQVIQLAKARGVRVHVIGFGMAIGEREQAMGEFTQLAEQTGGSVSMEVQTAMQLIHRLDSLTEPESFRVRLPDGRWVASRCGSSVELPAIVENNTPIIVDFQQTSTLVPVSPHAAIRLVPGKAGRLVRAQPAFSYAGRAPVSTADGHISPFEIVIATPTNHSQTMQWRLALERRDEMVVQRPKQLWVELRPISPQPLKESSVYVICDPLWQGETTQPVLAFETEDWPAGAEQGRVNFWCSDHMPEPLISCRCQPSTLDDNWLSAEDQVMAGRVQYQVQSEPNGVTVVLLHSQASEVEEVLPMIEDLPMHTKVQRRYCPSQRISVHRFQHPELAVQASFELSIYSVNAFKAQALRSSSLEVSLQRNVASIPVEPRY